MNAAPYSRVMLFMGILSVKGFPDALKEKLEDAFGEIDIVSERFSFDFTDYYVPEMGEGIERFFISLSRLVLPDALALIKETTNEIEALFSEDGKRKINLDPGLLSESNVVLATTKNRAHRIAIGRNLYAEITLIYQNKSYRAFDWTYADYRSEKVQDVLKGFRNRYKELRKLDK